jgi:hypothetical protein
MKWLLLCLLVGCGGKSDSPEAAADPKKAACDSAITRGVDMTLERRIAMTGGENSPNMKKLVDELKPKLKATLSELCVKDQWADSVVSCFQTASDIATCKNSLTPEQRGKYTSEMMRVMMAQGGPGMRGMRAGHGSGSGSN